MEVLSYPETAFEKLPVTLVTDAQTGAGSLAHEIAALLCRKQHAGELAGLGLANLLMWPAILPLSFKGLGRYAERAAALVIMGIGGGAALLYVCGKLGERVGLQQAYLLLPCYAFAVFAGRGPAIAARRAVRYEPVPAV